MTPETDQTTANVRARALEIWAQHRTAIYRNTDHLFAGLLVLQWLAGIAAAYWISPRTWVGSESQVHVHVWAALLLGGVIALPPAVLAWWRPGETFTRHRSE